MPAALYDYKYRKAAPRNLKGRVRKPWRAVVYINNRRYLIGNYATKEEAEQRACLEYERHLYGDDPMPREGTNGQDQK